MGEHGEGYVEVIVGVRAPGESPFAAELSYADRALHCPEVRVGEWDVDGVNLGGVAELLPVGSDHVGGRRKAGNAAELSHDPAAGEAALRSAWVFGVGENVLSSGAQADGFFERPGAIGVKCDAGSGEAFGKCGDGFDLRIAGEYAAL